MVRDIRPSVKTAGGYFDRFVKSFAGRFDPAEPTGKMDGLTV
ncbi:MAG: hypothetical protein V6Z81_11285 [Parvularculales bacterium]